MDLSTKTETFTGDDQRWLASRHGSDAGIGITLRTASFTANTHYPNGYFPSGLALGKITATGLYAPYTPGATDGTQTLAGFLFTPIKAPSDTTVNPGGVLFNHGNVRLANLPIAIDTAGQTALAGRVAFV